MSGSGRFRRTAAGARRLALAAGLLLPAAGLLLPAAGLLLPAAGLLLPAATGAGADGGPVLLIVAGVGGTPEHREQFSGWASELCAAAGKAPGAARVRVLVERPPDDPDGGGLCIPRGRSTLDELAREIAAVEEGADLVLVLIGHGSGGANPRFQIPGPDLAPARLAELLDAAPAGSITVAHLGSAAGAFLPALSAPGRVLLAASRERETNETRFPGHFVAAFTDGEADRNKDGRLSALEAFDFARRGVERDYEREGLLRTEHALLDDNGDGTGSLEPGNAPGADGVLAARRPLLLLTAEAAADLADSVDPEVRELVARREALAARVDELRAAREAMEEEAYLEELEALLVQIAEISERITTLREPSP